MLLLFRFRFSLLLRLSVVRLHLKRPAHDAIKLLIRSCAACPSPLAAFRASLVHVLSVPNVENDNDDRPNRIENPVVPLPYPVNRIFAIGDTGTASCSRAALDRQQGAQYAALFDREFYWKRSIPKSAMPTLYRQNRKARSSPYDFARLTLYTRQTLLQFMPLH